MDISEDTKKEDLALPKPSTGVAIIEPSSVGKTPASRKGATQSEPIPPGYIRDARTGALTKLTNLGRGTINTGNKSANSGAITLQTSSSQTNIELPPKPITSPVKQVNSIINHIPVHSDHTPSTSSSSSSTTINNALNEKHSESSATSPPGKSVTISEEHLKNLIALANNRGPTGVKKNSIISSTVLSQQEPTSEPLQHLDTAQHSSTNKRQRSCPPDMLDQPLRVSSAAKGIRNVRFDEDDTESVGEDSAEDLSDMEEEPDPMAVAIDEKVTALAAVLKETRDGLVALHRKFDALADFLSRCEQSRQKTS